MPRPKDGYRNAAGLPVPGTSDINGRFMDRSRLLYWAFNRGKSGAAKLYDNDAVDIGTCVHAMAELDMKGETEESIRFYLAATLRDPDQREKASNAFDAFRQWRQEFHVSALHQEVSLVSERLQFGGTIDTVARIRNGRGLVDFKTTKSGEVYEDMPLQLAAYGILWDETHPDEPLDQGYHLILLPKDGGRPIHREFTHEQLNPFRQLFWLYRRAYDYAAVTSDPKTLAGIAVAPSVKPAEPKVHAARKPRAKPAIAPRPSTMAEMLRSYGHVREVHAS